MTGTAIRDDRTVGGLARTVAAALFALVLALAMTSPALAQDEAGAGSHAGVLQSIDTDANSFVTQTPQAQGDATFFYDGDDSYDIGHPGGLESGVAMEQWECIAELTVDEGREHFINIDYDPDGESNFNLNTNVSGDELEDCDVEPEDNDNDDPPPDDDNGEPEENDVDDNDEPEEVEQPDRVDTGAGGTAVNGAVLLVFLLGLGLGAGLVTLREATSS